MLALVLSVVNLKDGAIIRVPDDAVQQTVITSTSIGAGSIAISVSVCLSVIYVCLSACISHKPDIQMSQNVSMCVTIMQCISGFVDNFT